MSTYYALKFPTMGKRIEARLVALDMNQTDLHNELTRLGARVSRSFISQLIGDKKSISAENLTYLARALDTTTDHLLLLEDDPEPRKNDGPKLSLEIEQLAWSIEKLSPERQAMVKELVMVVVNHDKQKGNTGKPSHALFGD